MFTAIAHAKRAPASQAGTLIDILHGDTNYPAGSLVLEAMRRRSTDGHSGAAQPGGSFHLGRYFGGFARGGEESDGCAGPRQCPLPRGRVLALSFASETFDHVFVSLPSGAPSKAGRGFGDPQRLLKDGTITVIEGDHGSAYFHPDSKAAKPAIQCQNRAPAPRGRQCADRPAALPADARCRFADGPCVRANRVCGREQARSRRRLHEEDVHRDDRRCREPAIKAGMIEPEILDEAFAIFEKRPGRWRLLLHFFQGNGERGKASD